MRDFTLIFGCMFAGKTTRLIGLYNESQIDINEKLAVKPLIDNRYSAQSIYSHAGLSLIAHRIGKAEEIYPLINQNIKEVYIDEIQFMGPMIAEVIGELLSNNIKVIAAGLDKDYQNNDFGPMPILKKLATSHIQVSAKCKVCNQKADYTFRNIESNELILIGHNNIYEPRCLEHWQKLG
jgi:thymidine kinase